MKKKKKNEILETEETRVVTPIEAKSQELLEATENVKEEFEDYYERMRTEDLEDEIIPKVNSMKRAIINMSKAGKDTYDMKDEMSSRLYDAKQEKTKKLIQVPANATIDYEEKESNHFSQGINIYKILWICFIGSFAGVVIEMFWCFMRNGYIQSRAGLVYGPFNILYGVGAVALTLSLYKFRNRGSWLSFLGGFAVGSIVEYVCSWGQELVLGTRSWDYSNVPFNLNGRICLLYSVFWGILGVLWIKSLYPIMSKWILKIPNKIGKIATWVIAAFFIVNITMSGLALTRWTQRDKGIEPSNAFWESIDERFPDERMQDVYANMEFSE